VDDRNVQSGWSTSGATTPPPPNSGLSAVRPNFRQRPPLPIALPTVLGVSRHTKRWTGMAYFGRQL